MVSQFPLAAEEHRGSYLMLDVLNAVARHIKRAVTCCMLAEFVGPEIVVWSTLQISALASTPKTHQRKRVSESHLVDPIFVHVSE